MPSRLATLGRIPLEVPAGVGGSALVPPSPPPGFAPRREPKYGPGRSARPVPRQPVAAALRGGPDDRNRLQMLPTGQAHPSTPLAGV